MLCQIQDSGKKQTECYADPDPDPRPSSQDKVQLGFSDSTFTWIPLPSVGLIGRKTCWIQIWAYNRYQQCRLGTKYFVFFKNKNTFLVSMQMCSCSIHHIWAQTEEIQTIHHYSNKRIYFLHVRAEFCFISGLITAAQRHLLRARRIETSRTRGSRAGHVTFLQIKLFHLFDGPNPCKHQQNQISCVEM